MLLSLQELCLRSETGLAVHILGWRKESTRACSSPAFASFGSRRCLEFPEGFPRFIDRCTGFARLQNPPHPSIPTATVDVLDPSFSPQLHHQLAEARLTDAELGQQLPLTSARRRPGMLQQIEDQARIFIGKAVRNRNPPGPPHRYEEVHCGHRFYLSISISTELNWNYSQQYRTSRDFNACVRTKRSRSEMLFRPIFSYPKTPDCLVRSLRMRRLGAELRTRRDVSFALADAGMQRPDTTRRINRL